MLPLKTIVGALVVSCSQGALSATPIQLPAGSFLMGSEQGKPDERPVRKVEVKAFLLDQSPVSVLAFSKWLKTSSYITEADKFGSSNGTLTGLSMV